ncbi:outer membrane beta-barrel protein [Sphingobacterium cellulitidis]|uniref:outer membrane beta-barrel protein n=1 Tax=Sphingobacterium cellulitidis TaxID=1768011 RepID=UPI003C7C41C0
MLIFPLNTKKSYYYYDFTKRWSINFSGGYGFFKFNPYKDELGNFSNETWSYPIQFESYFNLKNAVSSDMNIAARRPYASGIYKTEGVSSVAIGIRKGLWKEKAIINFSVTDIFNTILEKQTMDYQSVWMSAYNKNETRSFNLGYSYKCGSKKTKYFERKENIKEIGSRM